MAKSSVHNSSETAGGVALPVISRAVLRALVPAWSTQVRRFAGLTDTGSATASSSYKTFIRSIASLN